MSFNKFESDSYCVGGRHRRSTTKIYGNITSKGSKVLIGYCSACNRKKSMTISDNTIKADGLGSFFKNVGTLFAKAGKKLQPMYQKILLELLKLVLTLPPQLQVEILKTYYQHNLNWLIFIIKDKACISENLYIYCAI